MSMITRHLPLSVLGLSLALGGCALDSTESGAGQDDPRVGESAQASTQTVTLNPNVNCSNEPGVEAELTSFVSKAEASFNAQSFGGVAGYSIFASRRTGPNGALCAVSASGGWARTLADFPVLTMTATTTSAVGSVSKVLTAAYLMDLLKANGISPSAAIGPYLPPSWTLGPGVAQTTFHQLLTHTSGLATIRPSGPNADVKMMDWLQNGCLAGPKLTATATQFFGGANIGVAISVKGTWGSSRDTVTVVAAGAPPGSPPVFSGYVQNWSQNADGERWDGNVNLTTPPAGNYVARLYFNGDTSRKRAEIPFHVDSSGNVTQQQSSFVGDTCPFSGAYRYSNPGYQILSLLAAMITTPSFASLYAPGTLMQVAGQREESYVHAHYTQPIYDGYTPIISGNTSCNSYKDYYAWTYPASSTTATHGSHDVSDDYTGCPQGTWYLSSQDLNFLLDRMHWDKAGSLGYDEELVVGKDIYGTSLRYGYGPTNATPNGFAYVVKGGLLPISIGTYQAMAAHFPDDTTVTVLVNSPRDLNGQSLYDPIEKAWDDSHPVSLWLDAPSPHSGDPITIHFSGAPGNTSDWIGIYPKGTTPAPQSTAWDYAGSGTHTVTTGVPGGAVTLTSSSMNNPSAWPLAPGSQWSAYYCPNDGYTCTAKLDFTVQ